MYWLFGIADTSCDEWMLILNRNKKIVKMNRIIDMANTRTPNDELQISLSAPQIDEQANTISWMIFDFIWIHRDAHEYKRWDLGYFDGTPIQVYTFFMATINYCQTQQ